MDPKDSLVVNSDAASAKDKDKDNDRRSSTNYYRLSQAVSPAAMHSEGVEGGASAAPDAAAGDASHGGGHADDSGASDVDEKHGLKAKMRRAVDSMKRAVGGSSSSSASSSSSSDSSDSESSARRSRKTKTGRKDTSYLEDGLFQYPYGVGVTDQFTIFSRADRPPRPGMKKSKKSSSSSSHPNLGGLVERIVQRERKARLAVRAEVERRLAGVSHHGMSHRHHPGTLNPEESSAWVQAVLDSQGATAPSSPADALNGHNDNDKLQESAASEARSNARFGHTRSSSDAWMRRSLSDPFTVPLQIESAASGVSAFASGAPLLTSSHEPVSHGTSASHRFVAALCQHSILTPPDEIQLRRVLALADLPGLPLAGTARYTPNIVLDRRAFAFLLSSRARDSIRALGRFLRSVARRQCGFLRSAEHNKSAVQILERGVHQLMRYLTPGYMVAVLESRTDLIRQRRELKGEASYLVEAICSELFDLCDALSVSRAFEGQTQSLYDMLSASLLGFQAEVFTPAAPEADKGVYHPRKAVAVGYLRALGDASVPIRTSEDLDRILAVLSSHLKSSSGSNTKILVSKAMTQIAYVVPVLQSRNPRLNSRQIYEEVLFPAAVQLGKSKALMTSCLQSAVDLAIACTLHSSTMTNTVHQWLRSLLVRCYHTRRDVETVQSNVSATTDGMTAIALKNQSLVPVICRGLVDFLLAKAGAFAGHPEYEPVRDSVISALCNILQFYMTCREDDCTRLVSQLFVTLHTPLYHAHTKYAKRLGQTMSNPGYSVRSVRLSSIAGDLGPPDSWGPAAGKSTQDDKQRQDEKFLKTEVMICDIVVVLGQITASLDDPRITSMILSRLAARVHYPPKKVDKVLIEQLTNICILGQEAASKEIIDELMNVFKRELTDLQRNKSDDASGPSMDPTSMGSLGIPAAFLRMAREMPTRNHSMRRTLINRMSSYFQQLGREVSTPKELVQTNPLVQGMGYLLPILADLFRANTSNVLDPDLSHPDARLNRALWLYIVAYNFTDRTFWRSDWYECVKVIARGQPVLVFNKLERYTSIMKEIDGFITSRGYTSKHVAKWSATLLDVLGTTYKLNIRALSPAETLYALSVYYLETLRAGAGSVLGIFAYLEDVALADRQGANLMGCIKGIAAKVFPVFLDYVKGFRQGFDVRVSDSAVKTSSGNFRRDDLIEAETIAVAVKFCSSSPSAREVAGNFLTQFEACFPQVLWNVRCVSTFLQLVDKLARAARQPLLGAVTISVEVRQGGEPVVVEHQLQLEDGSANRQKLLQTVTARTRTFLHKGLEAAPNTVSSMLQQMLLSNRRARPTAGQHMQHVGEALVVQVLGTFQRVPSQIATSDDEGLDCVEAIGAIFTRDLNLKSQYYGEVRGMIQLGIDTSNPSVVSNLVDRLAQGLQTKDVPKFEASFFRACALICILITEEDVQSHVEQSEGGSSVISLLLHLMRLVVKQPLSLFTSRTLRTALLGWSWILGTRRSMRVPFLFEIRRGWMETIDRRLGVFSDRERRLSPLEQSHALSSGRDSALEDQLLAHQLWIRFLREMITTSIVSSPGELEVLAGIFNSSLQDPARLCSMPSSLTCRFELLSATMKLLHMCSSHRVALTSSSAFLSLRSHSRGHSSSSVPITTFHQHLTETLLRERMSAAALQWFAMEPAVFSDPHDFNTTKEDASAFYVSRDSKVEQTLDMLMEFCRALNSEEAALKEQDARTQEQRELYAMLDIGSNKLKVKKAKSARAINVLAAFNRPKASGKDAKKLSSGAPQIVAYSQAMSLKVRQLLLLLIGSEIDRIMAWTDPTCSRLRVNPFSVTDDAYAYNPSAKFSPNWDIICDAAWSLSPRLCILLHERFSFGQAQKRIRRFLVKRIELSPLQAAQVPSAVKFVLGQDVVARSSAVVPLSVSIQNVRSITHACAVSSNSAWALKLVTPRYSEPLLASVPPHARALSQIPWNPFQGHVSIEACRAAFSLKPLLYWSVCNPAFAVDLLRDKFRAHPLVTRFSVRVLHAFPADTIMFYLPQLVQGLRYDTSKGLEMTKVARAIATGHKQVPRGGVGIVHDYLVAAAHHSDLLAQQLIWNTQTYSAREGAFAADDAIAIPAESLRADIVNGFRGPSKQAADEEFGFLKRITDVSGILTSVEKPRRKARLRAELAKIDTSEIPPSAYVPSSPDVMIHGIEPARSTSLQSAAKAPILVAFHCHDRRDERVVDVTDGESSLVGPFSKVKTDTINGAAVERKGKIAWTHTFAHAVIFKTDDDLRQDMIALQVVSLFDKIFKTVDLDLFLYPYQVIATGPGEGIIEVVQNSISRNDLGKQVSGIVEWFRVKYGSQKTPEFQEARLNFIKSLAGYAVVCYILQVKDRHNGNIMFDDKGHIVHIDFGFIFDSSPGGNIGFEVGPFKLSAEMIQLMGERGNDAFNHFVSLTVKAFLACRRYAPAIITLVQLMLDTKLPCFRGKTIESLQERLSMKSGPNGDEMMSDIAAAQMMTQRVADAHGLGATVAAKLYDEFQFRSQGINR